MNSISRIEAAIALAGLVAVGVVAYTIYMISSTVQQLRPLIQMSNDIEVTISSAHLWFEEAMQGDKSIDLNKQVYGNIDAATATVQEFRNQLQLIEPDRFEQMEERLGGLTNMLYEWREQTTARWTDQANGAPGTRMDQAYDALFQKILRICYANKMTIDSMVIQRQKMLTRMNASLIGFLILVFAMLFALSMRYRKSMQDKNLTVMKLSQAVEQTDDLVMITDKEGLIQYVNPAFEKLTGFTNKEAFGRKPSILKSGRHDQAFYETLWQAILAGEGFRSEIINQKKNGELFYEEKTISPIRNAEGIITHYVSTGKDITERKKIEKELIHSREMKMIGQLASGVAHEVRNPLNAILAISEAMFHDFSGQPEYTEYLTRIRSQVDRLSTLMRDLLQLGKPIPQSTMTATPLVTLCKNSVDLWKQYHTDQSHPILLMESPDERNVKILANREKLQQVFINLLDNASQNSPPDSEIRIVIDKLSSKQVRIRIQDLGKGIAVEPAEKLFEPFFTTRNSGTGLGLSIVKHIIETHGGTVSIRNNNPAPGCCIEMILPSIESSENEAADSSD